MAIVYTTRLTCNNKQKLKEILVEDLLEKFEVEFKDGYILIYSRRYSPESDIMALSEKYKDLVFIASYWCEADGSNTSLVHEYYKGILVESKVEVNYGVWDLGDSNLHKINLYRAVMGDHYTILYDKAIGIFRRIDIVKFDKKRGRYVEYINGISLIVEDEKYQMRLSKRDDILKMTCFKKQNNSFVEITENSNSQVL